MLPNRTALAKSLLTLSFAGIVLPLTAQSGSPSAGSSAMTSPSSAPSIVRGTVLSATTGMPVSRALVRLNDRAMLTDHEGKFEFDQFPATGSAVLEARKPGFYFSPETGINTMTLRGEQLADPIVVRLYPEALMTGTLTASDGTPLSRVFVTAQRSSFNETGHQWLPTAHSMTNSRGEFRLPVSPGDYRIETNFSLQSGGLSKAVLPLVVPSPGSAGADGTIHMSSGAEERFDLHPAVSPTYVVTLRLESSQERGFPMLLARSSDGSVLPVSVIRSGPGGGGMDDVRIALPSGTYTLTGTSNRGETMEYGETTVTVADRDLSGETLRLAPVAPISIQVITDSESTSDKTPPTAQQLGLMMQNVQDVHIGFPMFAVTSGGDRDPSIRPTPGVYRFSARNTGQWFVKSATYGTTDLLQQNMTVAAGAGSSSVIVTISNQTGSLLGTTKRNGIPGPSWISVVPAAASAVPFYNMRSNMDGSFNFSFLPPGTYQVISFESRHSLDYRDPKALAPFSTYVRSATITSGNKATLDLDAVPDAELNP